eukprot:TRINITY_DN105332_c0_g1_i1.p1 TRINITY_DN105332_c0_g1~~TRINITY_DN105332_c0_g1_i1.p1  ORF type:complete len:284 (+),score=54.43 TRINITY_DN105332_c0_g1_i1:38-853(+)
MEHKKWWHRILTRDGLIMAAASVATGLVVTGLVVTKIRSKRAAKQDTEVTKITALVAAMALKPAFSKRLLELAAFKDRVGHCDVPLGSATGSKLVPVGLGKWVYAQRKRKADEQIKADEEAALVSLGFRWKLDPEELDVDEMLDRLAAYKVANGDTLVPKKYEADPLLGAWVAAMRRKADPLLNGGQSALPPELRQQLDQAGFSWEPARRCGSSFMTGFRTWSEAKVAGKPVPDDKWCELQREARRQGKLSEQRISYLDKFDFDWEACGAA